MTNSKSEGQFITQLKVGDRKAIATFIDTYGKFIYNVIYRILQNAPDSEEATQDAVLKVIKNLSSYNLESSMKAWCYTIAYRTAIDYKRKIKMHHDLNVVENLASVQNIDETVRSSDNKILINHMMKALDDESKAIITLYYLEEKNVKEITEYTGLTESNIKIKLHRARKQMSEFYNNRIPL